jgi:hypothetical protein
MFLVHKERRLNIQSQTVLAHGNQERYRLTSYGTTSYTIALVRHRRFMEQKTTVKKGRGWWPSITISTLTRCRSAANNPSRTTRL